MINTNLDLRLMIEDAGIRHLDVAKHLGKTPQRLSQILARPVSQEMRSRIIMAIEESKNGR